MKVAAIYSGCIFFRHCISGKVLFPIARCLALPMAGKEDPLDQEPYPSTDWEPWDTENPYATTDFTVPVNIDPYDWW